MTNVQMLVVTSLTVDGTMCPCLETRNKCVFMFQLESLYIIYVQLKNCRMRHWV